MTKREDIVNGNMANSMEEVRLLGKQMENMRDEQQLEVTNRIADPQQFDEEEEKDLKNEEVTKEK